MDTMERLSNSLLISPGSIASWVKLDIQNSLLQLSSVDFWH